MSGLHEEQEPSAGFSTYPSLQAHSLAVLKLALSTHSAH